MSKKKIVIIILVVICVLVALLFGVYKLMKSREHQLFGKIVTHGDTEQKVAALTFDDGPTDKTPEILEMLDDLDVKCTFFLTGNEMSEHMEYTQAIINAGHQVGNHSYSHQRMVFKSNAFIQDEIDTTNDIIREAGFTGEILFRAPFCKKLVLLPLALKQRDIVSLTWNLEPDSYAQVASSPKNIADYVTENICEGSIVLLHIMNDSNTNGLDSVPLIVTQLREKGYAFVTVNELLALSE